MPKPRRKPTGPGRSRNNVASANESRLQGLREPPTTVQAGHRLSEEPAGPPPDFPDVTDLRKKLFLQAVARLGPRYDYACRAAGVCSKTGYNWRQDKADVAFQAAFATAHKLGIEAWESSLSRRGFEGYAKPVYHQGRLVGTEKVYDTTAAIFMLKGALPEKYKDRWELGNASGRPLEVSVYEGMTAEELEARVMRLAGMLGVVLPRVALPEAPAVVDVVAVPVPEPQPEPSGDTPEALLERYARELERRKKNGHGGNGHA